MIRDGKVGSVGGAEAEADAMVEAEPDADVDAQAVVDCDLGIEGAPFAAHAQAVSGARARGHPTTASSAHPASAATTRPTRTRKELMPQVYKGRSSVGVALANRESLRRRALGDPSDTRGPTARI